MFQIFILIMNNLEILDKIYIQCDKIITANNWQKELSDLKRTLLKGEPLVGDDVERVIRGIETKKGTTRYLINKLFSCLSGYSNDMEEVNYISTYNRKHRYLPIYKKNKTIIPRVEKVIIKYLDLNTGEFIDECSVPEDERDTV